MKVLEILPSIASEDGGSVRSTLANCRAVRAADPAVRFTLVTTDAGLDAEWRQAFEAEMPGSMELRTFTAIGRRAFVFSPQLATWLWRHVTDFDLVVVRKLFNPVSSLAAYISADKGVPYVVVPHGTLSRYTFTWRRTLLKRAYYRLLERRTLAGAAAVRFTCETEREEAPAWGGTGLVRVIPHPYEPRFDWTGSGLPRNGRQVLFLSRLDPKKGIDVLLAAVRDMRRVDRDIRLVLAGSGTVAFERRLRSQIRRLGLDGAVTMPGWVEGEQKVRLLGQSAVFVLPSLQENFGVAVVEAMDSGLPVVISRNVGISAEVESAGAGVVVEPLTPEALASTLLRLLTNEPLRAEMGRRACKLVARAFDPDGVGRQLSELYRSAAGLPRETAGGPREDAQGAVRGPEPAG